MTPQEIQKGIASGEIKTIDCTPTWSALLPIMLDLHAQFQSKENPTSEQRKSYDDLCTEFKRMAKAADEWVEWNKEQQRLEDAHIQSMLELGEFDDQLKGK